MKLYPFQQISNEPDELHCFQAAFGMVIEGLTGVRLGLHERERETAFKPGMQSWPFAGLLALSRRGLKTLSWEDFDPQAFINNAEQEIRRQVGDDSGVADFIIQESNLDQEVSRVIDCQTDPNITFKAGRPDIEGVMAAISRPGTMAIVNVNYRALIGKPGYYGHFMVIEAPTEKGILVHNPGPPSSFNEDMAIADFMRGWHSPSARAANALIISNEAK